MPRSALKCIKSWNNCLPDYDLQLWNEDNFDVGCTAYTSEAYEAKKYAFVSDYVRLWALFNYGGVYMDTDVEVIEPLDCFLDLPAFSGFESETFVPTGVMGSEQYGEWVREQLEYYTDRHFVRGDGSYDMTTNVETISKSMSENGFALDNTYQVYKGRVHVFPKEFFCPKSSTGRLSVTDNTHCIHHFASSWNPVGRKIKKLFFRRLVGPGMTETLVALKRSLSRRLHSKNASLVTQYRPNDDPKSQEGE